MAVALNHLRREILRRPAERVALVIFVFFYFSQTEICQVEVPILIKQDILKLQIPVQDILLMQMANG